MSVIGLLIGSKAARVGLLIAFGAAAVSGVWYHGHGYGEKHAAEEFNQLLLAEKERLEAVNREMAAKALEREKVLTHEVEQAQSDLRRLRQEARDDPDAGNTSLGADSVRRLRGFESGRHGAP